MTIVELMEFVLDQTKDPFTTTENVFVICDLGDQILML